MVDPVAIINLASLNKDERVEGVVTKDLLLQWGYLKTADIQVKILGNGDLDKALSFEGIEKFSKSAQQKIEKAGGAIK